MTEGQSCFVRDKRHPKFEVYWGCSSVGRAVALQAIGQEFDPPQLHQLSLAAKQERGCRIQGL